MPQRAHSKRCVCPETLPNQSPLCRWGRTERRSFGSRSPSWLKEGKEKREQGFLPTHPSHLSTVGRWRGLGRAGCEVFTLLDSTVPSPSWALTRRVGWDAPGAQDALLGAPCLLGPARGPGTRPGGGAGGGGAGVLQDGSWSSPARGQGRGLPEGRSLCAQGAGSTHWGRACVAVSEISLSWGGGEFLTSGAWHPTRCVPRPWKKEEKISGSEPPCNGCLAGET